VIFPEVSLFAVTAGVVPGNAGKSSELIVKALDSETGCLTIPTTNVSTISAVDVKSNFKLICFP